MNGSINCSDMAGVASWGMQHAQNCCDTDSQTMKRKPNDDSVIVRWPPPSYCDATSEVIPHAQTHGDAGAVSRGMQHTQPRGDTDSQMMQPEDCDDSMTVKWPPPSYEQESYDSVTVRWPPPTCEEESHDSVTVRWPSPSHGGLALQVMSHAQTNGDAASEVMLHVHGNDEHPAQAMGHAKSYGDATLEDNAEKETPRWGSMCHAHSDDDDLVNHRLGRRRTAKQPYAGACGMHSLRRGSEPVVMPRMASLIDQGEPFPQRPRAHKLSQAAWDKIEEVFRVMCKDDNNVTRDEAYSFFTGAFGDAMFDGVDADGSGTITADEYLGFWTQVEASGYTEQAMLEELDSLLYESFTDSRRTSRDDPTARFPERPIRCRLSVKAWSKCETLFRTIDADGKLSITPNKVEEFWSSSFDKSVSALFNEVDVKGHGIITPRDWMTFWVQVRRQGCKDVEVIEVIDRMLEGKP
eukprot:CAMPEP_0180639032 /NCGR_PEP_ID=MMETSP1037_2-20121125/44715_1 /TAXON_ID=632150 /ORGANISM="Azadinium spinosum, Strain 3D9" /LENGTH=464 /DNA_ID=CAMNT_0022660747 /DNA_START=54 /DNA_END=1444 /DNA_ORIENTATION=-